MMSRLAFVVGFAVTLLNAGCSAPPQVPATGDAVIYVIDRGWHTDVGLPVGEIHGPLTTLEAAFPGVRFLSFGFGERQFLLNRRSNFGAMLNALLPSKSALLATALRATPEEAFGRQHVVVLRVSQNGLERIEARMWQDLELSDRGQPVRLAAGPYPGSAFYAARETYDGLFTCNSWTAETLRAGGFPGAAGVLFSGQVMGLARWIAARQALMSRD